MPCCHFHLLTFAQTLLERLQDDPTTFGPQLVRDYVHLQRENETLRAEVATAKELEQEAQQALRQARGISSYLKNKQGELQRAESKTQFALRQAHGISSFLKHQNEALAEKLQAAATHELEAQLALRQARGVSAYLKSKNASLEKKLAASQTEQRAQVLFDQARGATLDLRSTFEAEATDKRNDEESMHLITSLTGGVPMLDTPSASTNANKAAHMSHIQQEFLSVHDKDDSTTMDSAGLSVAQGLYMIALLAMSISIGVAYP